MLFAEAAGRPLEESTDLNAVTRPENPLELWFTKAHLIADITRSIETIEQKRRLEPEDEPIRDQRGEAVPSQYATRREHTEALLRQRRQLLRALEAYPDDVVFGVCYFVSEEEIHLSA
jgi:hypothetical protein